MSSSISSGKLREGWADAAAGRASAMTLAARMSLRMNGLL
jgi:hypothetical protein